MDFLFLLLEIILLEHQELPQKFTLHKLHGRSKFWWDPRFSEVLTPSSPQVWATSGVPTTKSDGVAPAGHLGCHPHLSSSGPDGRWFR